MDRPAIADAIRNQLGQATRQGLFVAKASRRGLAVDIDGRPVTVSPDSVSQIIEDLAAVDVSAYTRQLRVGPLSQINLDPVALLKLRATLLLGTGEARWLSPDERRAALSRTFPRPRSALRPSESRETFLAGYHELPRVERERLLTDISEVIAAELVATTVVKSNSARDAAPPRREGTVRILEYDDAHVWPSVPGQPTIVTRRRTIRSLVDGLTEYRQSYSVNSASGATPRPWIVGIGELAVENLRSFEEDGMRGYRYDLVFTFPPLNAQEDRVLQWTVEVAPDEEAPDASEGLWVFGLAPHDPVDRAHISVRFSTARQPREAWRVDNVVPANVRLESSRADRLQPVDGFVEAEWQEVPRGLACALVCIW